MKRIARAVLTVPALLAATGSAVLAQGGSAPTPAADGSAISFYGGQYLPGPGALDDKATYGLRFTFKLSPNTALEFGLGTAAFEGEEQDAGTTLEVDGDVYLFDVAWEYAWRVDKSFSPLIGGGLGFAFTSVDTEVSGPIGSLEIEGLADDSFTINAGLGARIMLGKTVFLMPAAKWRWFEQREDEPIDSELTLGVGFILGG